MRLFGVGGLRFGYLVGRRVCVAACIACGNFVKCFADECR